MASVDLAARFSIPDYIVFVLMLLISTGIGFYYACSGSKQRTASEFLMANRSMGVLPIALSLLASYVSAIGLLGIPVEIYSYGTTYWCAVFSNCIVMPVSAYVYLPVFYHLQLTSAYEYLERRFNRTVRRMGSVIFIIQMMMYMAMVTYAPALALSQVTGLHVWGSVAAIGVVCTLYTTLGGMKAVMWTDVVQIMVMFAAMLAVIIQGLLVLGGFRNMLDIADRGGRLNTFNFETNPLERSTFWNLLFGGAVTWSAIYGVNQTQVQRYLTAPSLRTAQMALWWNLVGLFVALSTTTLAGLILYAFYANCDPLTSKVISAPDQLLPLFVMETLSKFPGLPGFFVAGIFSGSLSTLSSGLNSLAAVTLEDFVRPLCLKNLTDERAGLVSKFIALGYGILALALVAVVEQLGNILQAAISVFGMIGGPLLGIFFLGMFFPWANSTGAIIGLFSSLFFILWMGIGAHVVKVPWTKLPVTTVGCPSFNATSIAMSGLMPPIDSHDDISPFYKISFHWYSTIGWGVLIVVGLLVSLVTGLQNPEDLDARLFCSPIRKLAKKLPTKIRNNLRLNLKKQTGTSSQRGKQVTNVSVVDVKGADNPSFQLEEKPPTYTSKM